MKRKLFLLLCALLTMIGVQAAITSGSYYVIKNVANGQYLAGGNDYGTQGCTFDMPQWFKLETYNSGFSILSGQQRDNTHKYFGTNLYMDSDRASWTITEVTTGVYTISNGSGYLRSNGRNHAIAQNNDTPDDAAKWQIFTRDELGTVILTGASFAKGIDATPYIGRPGFTRRYETGDNPWTVTGYNGEGSPSNYADAAHGEAGKSWYCAESYHSTNGFKVSQTITNLKPGLYSLRAHAFYRQDDDMTENIPYMFVGSQKSYFPQKIRDENSMETAYNSFLSGNYSLGAILFTVTSTSDVITIGYAGDANHIWNIFGQTQLTYYGNSDPQENDDMTGLIVNPSFESANFEGWTLKALSTETDIRNAEMTGKDGTWLFNTWWQGVPLTQGLGALPGGRYKLTATVASSDGDGPGKVFLIVNGVPNDGTECAQSTGNTGYPAEYVFTQSGTGNVTIGAVGAAADFTYTAGGHWWYKADNFKLTYLGEDPEIYADALKDAQDAAKAIDSDAPMKATVKSALEAIIASDGNTEISDYEKAADVKAAIKALNDAADGATTSIGIYETISSAIDDYQDLADELDAAGQAAYDVSAIQTKYDNGTYETLAEAKTELSAAYRIAVKAQTTNGVDMTAAIVNHSFEDGEYTVGWNEGTDNDRGRKLNSNSTYTISNADGSYIFNTWSQGTPLTQNIGTLHAGYYKLSAIIASDGATVYLLANNTHPTTGAKTTDAKVGLTAEYLFYLSETTENVNIGVVGCNGTYAEAGNWWYKADNFRLTYYSSLPDAPTAVEGKMKVSIAEGQATAISAYNDDKTVGNYNAASAAVTLAQASVEAYKKMSDYLKTVETKVTNTTNFYTPTAYNNVYGNYKNGYENGTLTNEEATRSYQSASWAGTQRYDASTAAFLLIPGWTINDADATVSGSALYINSWSGESAGSGDAKDFENPFYEYYKGGGNSLDEATIVGTIPGLTGSSKYLVFANVRVEGNDKVEGSITMKVGAGTAVDVTKGNQIGSTARYIKRYVAMGETDASGNLTLTFTVAANSNVDWLSFRDLNYVYLGDGTTSNLDFTSGAVADGICIRTTAKDKVGNDVSGLQNVPGWAILTNGDNRAAGVMGVGSDTKLGNPGNVVPENGFDALSNGKVLGIEAVWTATTQYVQAVTLPAGSYHLVMPIYNQGGTTALATNLFGFVELDGTTHYATTTAYEVGEWTEEVISFTLAEETTGYISLGYTAANTGNANMPHLFVDRVTIGNASANMAVNDGKLGTFIAPFDITLPAGVKAYSATSDAEKVVLKKEYEGEETLPAGTPVIIYGDGVSVNQTFYGDASVTENQTVGALTGILNDSDKEISSGKYVLQTKSGTQAFYQLDEDAAGKLNRCYVTAGVSGNARLVISFEDDDPTAINAIEAANAKAEGLKDGKYLIDNKIVLVKNGVKYSANGQILK